MLNVGLSQQVYKKINQKVKKMKWDIYVAYIATFLSL